MGFVAVGALFGVYKSSVDATYEVDGHETQALGQAAEVAKADGEVLVGSTQALGEGLFSNENGFILPFEIVSILLLVAMIGAILLSKKELR